VRALVTGASGFIGRALVHRLIADGVTVRATSRHERPAGIAPVEWRTLSDADPQAQWHEAVSGCGIVIHLAALAHQIGRAAEGRSAEFRRVNAQLTMNVARAAVAAGAKRVVFVSSIAAMCSQSEDRVDERRRCEPQDDYGRSKLEAERALESELSGSVVDWCILRPPLIYGPGNPGNMARLLRLTGSALPLPLGAIHNQRSFMFIGNLIDAILRVVAHPGDIRATYIVGDDTHFSTPQLVSALAAASGRSVHMVPVPLALLKLAGRLGDFAGRVLAMNTGIDSYSVERLTGSLSVSSERFRREFNWQPPVDVESAIALTGKAAATKT
jgi:nucleoside-diphosphate-sugar epimerase